MQPQSEIYESFEALLQSRVAEAKLDAVALEGIVQQGSHWYGLRGSELDRFVRRMTGGLLNAGMVVVRQAPIEANVWWVLVAEYQLPIRETITKLLYDWKHASDGYAYFAWFTAPENVLETKHAKDVQPIIPPELPHKAAQGR